MNKKIYEIALQTGGSHYPEVGGKLLERYTQLLLKECINYCGENLSKKVGEEMLLHFTSDTSD